MASIKDPSTWPLWSSPEVEFQKIIKNNVAPKFTKENKISAIASTRKTWAVKYRQDAESILADAGDSVDWAEITIPLRDGASNRAIVTRPKKPMSPLRPLVVIIHGGGFCFGSAEMEAPLCIRSTEAYSCVCVSLEYRLAPENKFPTAFEDVWGSIEWLSVNSSTIGADPSMGFILGGTSAGGQITAALSHRARDVNLYPPLTGIYLNVPGLLDPTAVPEDLRSMYQSRSQNGGNLLLSSASVAMYDQAFEPDKRSQIWSPINWATGHADLPPTYFQVCGGDILRDEALIYERILRLNHGIKTKIDVYSGLPHVFWVNFPQLSASRRFLTDAVRGVGWLLEQTP